jgi:resuscitation-promoting factor RpfB
MSRIPAPGAIVGTTTISAVLALCLLGGVGATAPAAADEQMTDPSNVGASLLAAENTATVVGLTTTTSTLSGVTTNAAVTTNAVTTNAVTTNAVTTNAVTTNAVTTSAVATSNESAGAAASIETMRTLGLAGGVASEQIPAAAMLSAPAKVLTLPASLATRAVAAPKPVIAAITGTPFQIAHTIATREGLNQQQWVCLDSLWQQESKFQTNARNRRSGAFGIPQALPASRMASAGADWRTNPATQVKWGLSYIRVRYGTACNAWAHWKRDRWY